MGGKIVLITLLLFLNGCASLYPTDLVVSSLQVLERRDLAELPPVPSKSSGLFYNPYKRYIKELAKRKSGAPIKPEDINQFFSDYSNNNKKKNEKPEEVIIKVEFQSVENLHNLVIKDGYTLANKSYLCANKDREVILGWPNIYWRGLNLSYGYNYLMKEEKGKPFTYYTFIAPKFLEALPGKQMIHERIPTNDLLKYPEDVCFQIRGGYLASGFKSNVVVIPAEMIRKAISDKENTIKN